MIPRIAAFQAQHPRIEVAILTTAARFNDLPAQFQGNIDEELPLGQGQTDQGGTTAAPAVPAATAMKSDSNSQQDVPDAR